MKTPSPQFKARRLCAIADDLLLRAPKMKPANKGWYFRGQAMGLKMAARVYSP